MQQLQKSKCHLLIPYTSSFSLSLSLSLYHTALLSRVFSLSLFRSLLCIMVRRMASERMNRGSRHVRPLVTAAMKQKIYRSKERSSCIFTHTQAGYKRSV